MISFIERVEKVYRLFRTQVPTEDLRNIILLYHFLYKVYEQLNQREIFRDQLITDDPNYYGEIVKSKVNEIEHLFPSIFYIMIDLKIRDFLHSSQEESAEIFKILYQEELDQFEYYSNTFDSIIYFFNTKLKRTSQGGEEFTLSRIFKSLIGDVSSAYDPACGSGELLDVFNNGSTTLFGQDIDASATSVAKLRFIFSSTTQISHDNSLYVDGLQDTKVDAVISHPPYNTRFDSDAILYNSNQSYIRHGIPSKSNANMLWIQLALASLNPDGTAMILLPNSTLTSGGKEGNIRKALIGSGTVEAIITIPSSILMTSSVSCSIWVLSNRQRNHDEILMANIKETVNPPNTFLLPTYDPNLIKLAECYKQWKNSGRVTALDRFQAMSVNIEDIADNDFQLLPQRYLPIKELEGVDLDATVELRELLTPAKRIPFSKIQPDKVRKLSIKDLSTSVDNYKIDPLSLEEIPNENKIPIYQDNALLIAKVGLSLKPSYIRGFISEFIALSNVYSFKVDNARVSIDYLVQELNKDYVLHQVSRYRTGLAQPFIKKDDFLKVKINLPDLSEQLSRVKGEKEIRFKSLAKLHGFEQELIRIKEQHKLDLISRKHNILQPLSNASILFDNVVDYLEESQKPIKLDDEFDYDKGVTIRDNLLSIKTSLAQSINYVKNLTSDMAFGDPEDINVVESIRDFFSNVAVPNNVIVEDGIDEAEFILTGSYNGRSPIEPDTNDHYRSPLISISKVGIEQILYNIFENACKHGFVDESEKYIFFYNVSLICNENGNYIEILLTNNGKPFPKGMGTVSRFCTKGEKAGLTANTGEGGARICEIINHFEGELEVIDEPDSEFPVGFRLLFNLIEEYHEYEDYENV